jgi:hypothetical protein
MSVEQLLRPRSARRKMQHTYFVGRRPSEVAELFAVTATDVTPLRPRRRSGEPRLDWHGSDAARMELSHLLISSVAERPPSQELLSRFALYVLDQLPADGFVLDTDQLRRWLRLASDPEDFAHEGRSRHSWGGRLRSLFGGSSSTAHV